MKIEKNKILFSSILLVITLFIIAYAMMVLDSGEDGKELLKQTEVPKLEQQQETYTSKLEAVDNIEEARTTNAPSIYDERMLDSNNVFNPDLSDKEKQRKVDSIYEQGRIRYSSTMTKNNITTQIRPKKALMPTPNEPETEEPPFTREMALEHQLFFASAPQATLKNYIEEETNIHVQVDGDQVVRANSRLQLRLLEDIQLGSTTIPKNTLIYGLVSFKPNRALLKIDNIDHMPVKMKAIDLQDGLEGIYVENSFRGEVKREIASDIVEDINVVGLPQLRGVKNIFQRSNRKVKVKVADHYQLILKAY
ncbi:conjugative transposon protein TraM [Arenibacter aquaticus]|uniref:Conjugative transposon protein TraM n=1 Tax=Arenibacter aquaticus TaxID=2489054 RepID=A0A3S0AZM6_9FLAO|nr:conjugative transposon protein TraM [Arenibacter aquaticus]RTE54121.1 conjugative transposon protein TraM [Arenibacter aquaticus]